jgi:hypothetical protein
VKDGIEAVELKDVTGDGRLDLVALEEDTGRVIIYEGR